MWVKGARINGFGRLADKDFQFAEGLNCVYGPNEAGKTTLLNFVLSMLYGQATAGLKVRRLDAINEKYAPWGAPSYGGEATLVFASGKTALVRRGFGGDADSIELRDARTGNDILKSYPRGRTREYQFVDKEARIDKATYERVFVISHDAIARLDAAGDSHIADRLVALADSGEEKGGAAGALDRLKAAMEDIGSDRAPTKPYRRTSAALEEARQQYERVKNARDEYAAALTRQAELDEKVAAGRARVARDRAVLMHSASTVLAQIAAERDKLTAEEKRLAPAAQLPPEITEAALARAESDLAAALRRLTSVNSELDAATEAQVRTAGAVNALGPLAAVDETSLRRAQDAVTAFVECRRTLVDKIERHGQVSVRMREMREKWGGLYAALGEVSPADEEFLNTVPAKASALREESARGEKRLAELRAYGARLAWRNGAAASGALILAGVAVAVGTLLGGIAGLAIAVFSGALGVLCGFIFLGGMRRAKQVEREKWGQEEELRRLDDAVASVESRLAAITASFDGMAPEALVAKLRDYHAHERDIKRLAADAAALESQQGAALADVEDALDALAPAVNAAGLSISADLRTAVARFVDGGEPETADASDWEEVFRDADRAAVVKEAFEPLWQKAADARGARNAADNRAADVEKARSAQSEADKAHKDAGGAMSALLERAGAVDAGCLKTLLAQRGELDRVRAMLKAIADRERIILGGAAREAFAEDFAAVREAPEESGLLAEEGIPAGRRSLDETMAQLRTLETELAAASATVNAGLRNIPDRAAVEEAIGELEARHHLQAHHRAALEAAYRIIGDASASFHEEVYPKIEERLGKLVSRITLDAHGGARLWSDGQGESRQLRLSIEDAGRGAPVAPEALSQGALEQVYLCYRLALVDALSTEEPLPVMLDDPFINYDSARLSAGVSLLADTAGSRQVFLFTCQEDVCGLARSAGAAIIEL